MPHAAICIYLSTLSLNGTLSCVDGAGSGLDITTRPVEGVSGAHTLLVGPGGLVHYI